jgi:translation initiation factor IF-3
MQLNDALNLAYDKNLDLVLVSSNNPKVCKIMNYGKYKFEQSKKEKEARKKQKSFEMKEIRVTPNTDTHDFEFKAKNARKFLEDGNKLKITVRFRGREMNYKSQGEELLNKFVEALADIANTEKRPIMEGKNMFIILTKKS